MEIPSRSPVKMSKHTGQHRKTNKWKKRNSGISSKDDRLSPSNTDEVDSDIQNSGEDGYLSRDRSPEAVLGTAEYMMMVGHLWQVHQQEFEKYNAKPESHPKYYVEWTHFVQRRSESIVEFGENPVSYDFESEWKEFWKKRVRELEVDEWNAKKRTTLKISSQFTKFRTHQSNSSHCRRGASISSESLRSSRSRSNRQKCKMSRSHRKGLQRKIESDKRLSHAKGCNTFGSDRSRRSSTNMSGRSMSNSSRRSESLSYRSRSRSFSRTSSYIRRGRSIEYGKARSGSSVNFRSTSCSRSRSRNSSIYSFSSSSRSQSVSSSGSMISNGFRLQSSSKFQSGSPRQSPNHQFQFKFRNCSSNSLSWALKGASKSTSCSTHKGRLNCHISENSRKSKQKGEDRYKSSSSRSEEFKSQSTKHIKHRSKKHNPSSSKCIDVCHKKKAESCRTKGSKVKPPSPKASCNLIISKSKDEKDKPRNEVINSEEGPSISNERYICESPKYPKIVSSKSKDGITSPRKDRTNTKNRSHKSGSSVFRANIGLKYKNCVKVKSSKFREESNESQNTSKKLRSNTDKSRRNSPKSDIRSPVLRNKSPKSRTESPNLRSERVKPKCTHSDMGSKSSWSKNSKSRSNNSESVSHRAWNKSPSTRSEGAKPEHSHSDVRSKSPKSESKSSDLKPKNLGNRQESHEHRKVYFSSSKRNVGCGEGSPRSRRESFEQTKAIPKLKKKNPVHSKASPISRKESSENTRGTNQSRKESCKYKRARSMSREKNKETKKDSVNDRNESPEKKRARSSVKLKTHEDKKTSSKVRKKSPETRKKSPICRNVKPLLNDTSPRFRNASLTSVSENMESSKENPKFKENSIDLESDSSTDVNLGDAKPNPPTVTQEIVAKQLLSIPAHCSSSSLRGSKEPILPGLENLDREQLSYTCNDSSDERDTVLSPSSFFLKRAQTGLSGSESSKNYTARFSHISKMQSSQSDDEKVQQVRFSCQHHAANVKQRTCVKSPLLNPSGNDSKTRNINDTGIGNSQVVSSENNKRLMDPLDKLRQTKLIDLRDINSAEKFQSIYDLEDKYREVLPSIELNLNKAMLQSDVFRDPGKKLHNQTEPGIKTDYFLSDISRTFEQHSSHQLNPGGLSNKNSQVDNLGLPSDRNLKPHVDMGVVEKCSSLPQVKNGKIVRTLKLLCDLGDTLDSLAPLVRSIYLIVVEKEKIGVDPKDCINQADIRKIMTLVYGKLKASVDCGTIGIVQKSIRLELMQQMEDILEIGQNIHDRTYGLDIQNLACSFLHLSREQIVESIRNALIYKGKYTPTADIVTELYSLVLDEQLKLL